MEGRSVRISEREHFQIMCQVFEDIMGNAEYKSDRTKEALIAFSNQAHKKVFSPKKERLALSTRVIKATTEVLSGK